MTGTYRITGHQGWSTLFFGFPVAFLGGFFAVTGTQNQTAVSVKIVTKGATVAGGGLPGVNGGGTLNFNLNAGDVVQVMGRAGNTVDVSGSLLTANKPLQVITGMQFIDIPDTAQACD